MNPFGDLTRTIGQRPGDPHGVMSYADAMALRDRHRSGQPVDKDKLAEADAMVKATRAKVGYEPPKEQDMQAMEQVQEQPETAGNAGAPQDEAVTIITAKPGSMMAEMIEKTAAAEAAKPYHPKAGSLPWKLYRYLTQHPGKAMTRNQIAAAFGCSANGIDAQLDLPVSRAALVKARNSKMELTWTLGPSQGVVMEEGEWVDPDFSKEAEVIVPRFGRVDPPLKLVVASEPPPKPPEGKAEAKLEKMRADIQADMEPKVDRGNRLLLDKLKSSLPHWDGLPTVGVSSPASTPEESSSPAVAPAPQSDSVAVQPCAESPTSGATAAPPQHQTHEPDALPERASEAGVAPARQQSEVAVASTQPQSGAPVARSRMDVGELLPFGLDPNTLAEAIEFDPWTDATFVEERWLKFFDKFEDGDTIEVEAIDVAELIAWRSFYQAKSWDSGPRLFAIYPRRDGVFAMTRVL